MKGIFNAVWIFKGEDGFNDVTESLMQRLPNNSRLYEQRALDISYKGNKYNYYAKAYGIFTKLDGQIEVILGGAKGVQGFIYYSEATGFPESGQDAEKIQPVICLNNVKKVLPEMINNLSAIEMEAYLIKQINEFFDANKCLSDGGK